MVKRNLINIKIPGAISYCDFCTDEKKAVKAIYDAKTRMGFWAYLCEKHFQQFGVGLGLGKGQRLEKEAR